MELTKSQKIAIEFAQKNVLVSAGAGSGKTHVLVERFLNFVTSGKASVTEVLALTFTEKAANEMKRRLMQRFHQLGMQQARRDLELAYISTIHAFAARLLRQHPIEANVHPDFSVIESDEAELLQDQALDEIIEKDCLKGSDLFELLKTYGESEIRQGIKKILQKAKVEGLSLKDFFERQGDLTLQKDFSPAAALVAALRNLDEKTLILEFEKKYASFPWTWEKMSDFRIWCAHFSKKGGKENKAVWKEISQHCKQLMGWQLNEFSRPWREKFEKIAVKFEEIYEIKKFEKGVLDFDDLQVKALALLESPHAGNRKIRQRYEKLFKYILIDEFQDVNPLQVRFIESLASSSSSSQGRMFFVGDYKQSIYGFRGTSPRHFLHKEKDYQAGEAGLLIQMLENFRTDQPVLDFINLFFSQLWQEDDFEYTGLIGKEIQGAVFPPELLVVPKEEEEGMDEARMREAAAIAARIQELHAEGRAYGEMTLLFQALTGVGIYEHALKSAGIPYFVVSGRGFYYQPEIRDMMSLLGAIENPLLDIPLAAALRSPFFLITDDTLVWLSHYAKKENENQPLYRAFHDLDQIAEITADQRQKLQQFKKFFEDLIARKDSLRLPELLDHILRHTAYDLFMLADKQGVRRYANLRKLVDLARQHESREKLSLSDFIRLIRSLEAREIRESEAQVEAEESGRVVRLMTIHAAKGLEFPVCIVADLANRSQSPESKTFLAESGHGYAFQFPNNLSGEWEKSAQYEMLYHLVEERETQEWKRLFYVAATRAKSRLILSGVHEPKKNPKENFRDMSSWMDWVMSVASQMPIEVKKITKTENVTRGREAQSLAEEKKFQALLSTLQPLPQEKIIKDTLTRSKFSQKAADIYRQIESHEIPASRALDLPVSAYCAFAKNPQDYWRLYELGYADILHEKSEDYTGETETLSAADFGTCLHQVLEVIDLKDPARNLTTLLDEVFRGLEDKYRKQAEAILTEFFKSPVFLKLRTAKRIHREIPFVLNERHGRIDGVIDVLFEDASGDWHILDYKTAVGDDEKVKESAYDLQVGVYAAAAQEILKITPQSAILYFLKNQWTAALAIDAAFLSAQLSRIRELQQAIMDFRLNFLRKTVAKQ